MIDGSESVRVDAWGPLKIYFYGYVAPDAATAALVYVSIFWGMIANLIVNLIGVFLFSPSSGYFHVALIACISLSTIYSALMIVIVNKYKFVMLPIRKYLLQMLLFPVGLIASLIFLPNILFTYDDAGFLNKLAMYVLLYPFLLTPTLLFVLSNIASNILRPFWRK